MTNEKNTAAIHETPMASKQSTQVKSTKLSPAELLPKDLADNVAIAREYWYWIGVTPDCPCVFLTCGGINFPMMEDRIEKDPNKLGSLRRIPIIGKLQKLNLSQFDLIVEHLPLRMVRFERAIDGQPRKGHGVRIPSAKMIADAKESGAKNQPRYVQQADDVPAMKYLYAHLCEDQDNPQRGVGYPPTLAEVGIEWPDAITE